MKKIIVWLLAAIMVLGLAACGSSTDNSTKPSDSATKQSESQKESTPTEPQKKEIVTLRVYSGANNVATDYRSVQDYLNKYLEEKYGLRIELTIGEEGNTQQLQLALTTGGEFDVVSAGNINYAAQGALMPLDDLIAKYGQGLYETWTQEQMNAMKLKGQQYWVATYGDKFNGIGAYMDADICDEVGIDPASIHTYKDLTAAYAKVHEAYPQLMCVAPAVSNPSLGVVGSLLMGDRDQVCSGVGIIVSKYENGEKPVFENLYASDFYHELITTAKEWYDAGYITKDADTTTQRASELVAANLCFSYLMPTVATGAEQHSIRCAKRMYMAELFSPLATTNSMTSGFAITADCKYPDEAMQFINALYTDPYIQNTLIYGIENTHYIIRDDGVYDFPEGVTIENSTYHINVPIHWGNVMLAAPFGSETAEARKAMKEFNDNARVSPINGFSFDNTSVSTEIGLITNVISEYARALEDGTVDAEATFKAFNEKLEANEINTIIDEANKQFDEFWNNK